MVRIRVIHASRLLAVTAAVLLILVLAVLIIGSASGQARSASSEGAAQVVAAFSFWTPPPMEFEWPGEADDAQRLVQETVQPVSGRVLIYHTHTHEAYAQVQEDAYEETETWRTEDQTHSVVRVGEALCTLLQAYGVEVVHDTADYEYPKLNTAYARSLAMLEARRGEAYDLCIDLHRDAWDESQAECALIGTQRAAQLMMLLGRGDDFDVKPDYAANLACAAQLTDRINQLCSGLCRPVMTKKARYNQHVFTPSLIVEVGHNLNTLSEALSSMPVLAEAICGWLSEGAL